MANPTLPTLDEQQKALLAFLIANPDTPVSLISKGLGVRAEQATKIRENLTAHGLLSELEVRTGRIGAGRPTKFVIPTVQALELFGIEPPKGRAGVIHLVQVGVLAKGYSTQVEYTLHTGAIVDVHLERGAEKIAVEIAIASKPEREISHIRNCLNCGYNRVFVIFADDTLLQRTVTAVQETFLQEDTGKVRLLPLRMLSQLG
jgi:DNA-binding Lrp family transcriptional regulator